MKKLTISEKVLLRAVQKMSNDILQSYRVAMNYAHKSVVIEQVMTELISEYPDLRFNYKSDLGCIVVSLPDSLLNDRALVVHNSCVVGSEAGHA